jgi:hypothetical protein
VWWGACSLPARFTQNANIALLRAGRPSDDEFVFHIVRGNPDYSEPEPAAGDYSEPGDDGVAYSAAAEGDPEYCAPTLLDVPYWLTEEDGVPYDAAITQGNYIEHNWPGGSESIGIDDDVAITRKHTYRMPRWTMRRNGLCSWCMTRPK